MTTERKHTLGLVVAYFGTGWLLADLVSKARGKRTATEMLVDRLFKNR